MTTEIEKNNEDASHTGDKGQEQSNSNVQNNSFNPEFTGIDEVYDASRQHKIICSHKCNGYDDDLKGADFKTLEYPVVNTSYSLMDPGWLNDKIIDAYISLLVKAASTKGIRVQALNCFFYTCLRKFAFHLSDEERMFIIYFIYLNWPKKKENNNIFTRFFALI